MVFESLPLILLLHPFNPCVRLCLLAACYDLVFNYSLCTWVHVMLLMIS